MSDSDDMPLYVIRLSPGGSALTTVTTCDRQTAA